MKKFIFIFLTVAGCFTLIANFCLAGTKTYKNVQVLEVYENKIDLKVDFELGTFIITIDEELIKLTDDIRIMVVDEFAGGDDYFFVVDNENSEVDQYKIMAVDEL